MSNSYLFLKLGPKNRMKFEGYLQALSDRDVSSGDHVFGIIKDDETYGAFKLRKNGNNMELIGISIDYSDPGSKEFLTDIFSGIIEDVRSWGFTTLSCRYTDDDPGITKEVLQNAGFTQFYEESRVYRINAYSLGTLLRDGPYSKEMRQESVRLLDEGKVRVFSLAPEEAALKFSSLNPDPYLSFITLEDDSTAKCASIVSSLSDGSLYFAGLFGGEGMKDELQGLLYLSLAGVFMKIEPQGEFYFPAVTYFQNTVSEYILSPLKQGVDKQSIFSASVEL